MIPGDSKIKFLVYVTTTKKLSRDWGNILKGLSPEIIDYPG